MPAGPGDDRHPSAERAPDIAGGTDTVRGDGGHDAGSASSIARRAARFSRQSESLNGRRRSAAAGAAAAIVWALQEPLDQRLLRCDYSDVAVLGKALTRGPRWRAAGLAIHTFNGALFGLAHHELRRVLPTDPRKLALGMAVTEHVALYPLCYLVDRYHPARGEPGVPRLLTNPRAFAQATWRHALFGAILGQLASPK